MFGKRVDSRCRSLLCCSVMIDLSSLNQNEISCAVAIATGCGLDSRAIRRLKIFLHSAQTGSRAHSASYQMGTWAPSPEGEAVGT
jgi:hypothetical protein